MTEGEGRPDTASAAPIGHNQGPPLHDSAPAESAEVPAPEVTPQGYVPPTLTRARELYGKELVDGIVGPSIEELVLNTIMSGELGELALLKKHLWHLRPEPLPEPALPLMNGGPAEPNQPTTENTEMQVNGNATETDDDAARDYHQSEALLTVRVMLREDLAAGSVTEAEHDTISAWLRRRNAPLSARSRARVAKEQEAIRG